MLIVKKCSEVSVEDIVKAFNIGFVDYMIKLNMTEEVLLSRFIKVEQNQLENSFIAYDDATPIGLILGGDKVYEGVKTLRCGALCVAPEYRKLGVATTLFEYHKALAVNEGCKRLYLEVIQGNDKAINFYKKQGYRVLSELVYYSHSEASQIKSSEDKLQIEVTTLNEIESIHSSKVKSHLNWQNDFDYMRFYPTLVNYKLIEDGQVIGLISAHPVGKVFYLWIDPNYRRLGHGKALLHYLATKHNIEKLSISFPKEEALIHFVTKLGFTKDAISQFDMVMELK